MCPHTNKEKGGEGVHRKIRLVTISTLIILLWVFLSSVVLAADGSSASAAAEISSGKKLSVPKPVMPGDGVLTYIGFLVERYQPNPINSNNDNDYTQLVQVNGNSQWFINAGQAGGTEFILEYDKQEVRNTLFSDKTTLDGQGISNNITAGNSKFKIVVTHLFRLPDGKDLKSDPRSIYITLIPPDTDAPAITFSPDGGSFIGDVKVSIKCEDTNGVSESKYMWSADSATPAAADPGWTTFTDPKTAETGKSQEGTWYLHIKSKDANGNEANASKAYTITSRIAAAVKPVDNTMILAGMQGKITFLNKDGQYIKEDTWEHGTANIYAVITYDDGRILFAGQDGKYQIRLADGTWGTKGTWDHTGYSIKALTYIYDDTGKITGEILMAGSQGHWQARKTNGSLDNTKKGDCELAEEMSASGRIDGYIILAGNQGKVKVIKPDGATVDKEEQWTKSDGTADTANIYTVLALPDKSLLFAGQDGKYQIRKPDGTWGAQGTWNNTGQPITSLTLLPDGNVLMTGGDGHFQVLEIDTAAYTLTLKEKGQYLLKNTAQAFQRTDGRVLMAGDNYTHAVYKYSDSYDLSVNTVQSDKVTLNAAWNGKGFKNGILEWGTDGSTYPNSTAFSGTQATATGLTAGTTYYFRVRSLMRYPVYFTSKPVAEMPTMPVAISSFTDRVTGANKWIQEAVDSGQMTEQQIIEKGYNHYYPNSEVVCKFIIDPKGMEVDKYTINLDANTDNTAGIDISYLKVVKIDYDGVTKWGINNNPGPPGGADKPLCGKYDGSKDISFEIDNSDDKVVTVWCKYKIINPDIMENIPSEFRNRVEVTAESGGSAKTLEPQYNTIRLRKTKVQYM